MEPLIDTRKRFPSPDFPVSKKPKLHPQSSIIDPTVSMADFPKFPKMGNFVSSFLESRKDDGGGHSEAELGLGVMLRRLLSKIPKMGNLGNLMSCFFRSKKADDGWKRDVGLLSLEGDGNVVCRRVVLAKRVVESSLAAANRRDDCRLDISELEDKLAEQKLWDAREKEKELLLELFCPLTAEEENEVSYALHGGSSHQVLVTHEASNIEITRQVIRCLDCGGWLNDEVINLYLALLKERENREPKSFLKCHFFNTFFYKKLRSGKNGYDYNAVRRWTSNRKLGYSLIECDKIFVPIHRGDHWCLAVINAKDEIFEYLDSLGGMDTKVLEVLARYFVDEVQDKSDKHINISTWKHEIVYNLPQQENGFDCGMFMLKYTDFYSRGLGLCFNQDHMEYFRKRTTKEILRLRAE